MSEKLLTQVTFSSYRPKKDKSCSFQFITDLEVSSEDIKNFHELMDTRGILYFKPSGQLTTQEIQELDATDLEVTGKTYSQKLRNSIYVLWKKTNSISSKEEFYAQQMNKFLSHIQDQIPND